MKTMAADQIAVIDVETTGLSPWRNDRIVEIAVVAMSPDGRIRTEYETLVNPNRDLGPSRIHHISAADVLHAPTFAEVAGDVLELLAGANIIAGHNVSFDKNFIVKEYERLGIAIPEFPHLCTCQMFGRNSLARCCDELGVVVDGLPHRALSDARAAARLVTLACADDITILDSYRIEGVRWPYLAPRRTPCYTREQSRQVLLEPPRFLQRLVSKVHHDVEADTPNVLAYLALIDRVLEDRNIDACEEDALVDAALQWGLTTAQIVSTHKNYLHNLAVLALTDGLVTELERRDLHLVARLLGQDDSTLDDILESAKTQLATAETRTTQLPAENELSGKTVCFTGEIQGSIGGQLITRDLAEILAEQAGLIIANSVTKKLEILVVADPNTQSGKAKKARQLGIRILSDAVFWRLINVTVD